MAEIKLIGFPLDTRKMNSAKTKQWVQEARDKFEAGRSYRETKREAIWRRNERQYEGKHWVDSTDEDVDPRQHLLVVNMSFSTVNTIVPYVTGNEPSFIVTPFSRNATVRNARTLQALLNAIWRQKSHAAQQSAEDSIFDALEKGDGYIQVGYTIRDLRRSQEGDVVEIAEIWVERVSPWDIWIDPKADGFHNARWVAKRLTITRVELEADDRYSNLKQLNYGAKIADRQPEETSDVETVDGSETTELIEFYDLVNMRMIVFGDGESPVRVIEDIGDVPIVQIGNYRIPRGPYHMSELEQIWGLQQELNRTRTEQIAHRARHVSKYLAKKGALSPEAMETLKSSVVGAVAEVDGELPLDDIIQPVNLPGLSADSYNMSDVIRNDIFEISGINEYLRGAAPAIRRTATEATIIEGASNVKSQAKLRLVERALRKVGDLMLKTASDVFPATEFEEIEFYISGRDAERVNRADVAGEVEDRIANDQPIDDLGDPSLIEQDVRITPSPETFEGEFQVDVETASTELRNPVIREQRFREMALSMAELYPLLQEAGVSVNLKRLFELWFEAAGVDDIESIFEADNAGGLDQMLAQLMGAEGGQQGGPPGQVPLPGDPNAAAAQPPTDLITPDNTGALAPIS